MYNYKEYFSKIAGDDTKEKKLKEIVCSAIEKVKHYCPEEFHKIMYDVHCVAYGPHFDECLAKEAVAKMQNVDGTDGEHWSFEQIASLANQHNIKEVADLYYTMNMLYSDFSEVLGGDMGTFLKLSKAYMYDPDASKGKVFKIWVTQHKE